jgi:alanyl-tRNA synthetase
MAAVQAELAHYRGEELAASGEEIQLAGNAGRCRLVARAVDADANGLAALASAVVAKPGFLVVLVTPSVPALAVIARSADVSLSADKLLAPLIAQFGGRGGGRPEMARGGGLAASADTIIAAIRAAI